MSQSDVINILRKEKGWLTTDQISKKLDVSNQSVTNCLNSLYKQGEIDKLINDGRNLERGYTWRIRK